MKRILLGIAVSLMYLPMLASAALYEGSEAKACFAQHADPNQQVSCLQQKKNESELQLEKIIIEKNKQIKSSNVGLFNGKEDATETAGEVYSQRFLHAQKLWKQYRKELCLAVATEINEDAYDYQVFIDQCEINLNKKHLEEIKMMGTVPASSLP
ncbi:lysozyme inhibitor LprI family protein [Pseudescherichia vulneris]|uniref:lysozyme inhibitor LprI family protein n=1 Tax=Pseudescherichia vulneris TaxID=566 RepID=UPI0028D6086B|nr:lysozyme inhibitor LprI family protein [Pseudescherichia vulneris]